MLRSPSEPLMVRQHIQGIHITMLDGHTNTSVMREQLVYRSTAAEEVHRITPFRAPQSTADCLIHLF